MNVTLMIVGVLFAAAALAYVVFRPVLIAKPEGLPENFSKDGFSHDSFERLLRRFTDSRGRLDYSAWRLDAESRRCLRLYLGAVATWSPDNAPARFASKEDELAYWMYAYNALVIDQVLERWPLGSVTDVKAPFEVVRGLGFFYNLKFIVGGKRMSLYEIEHKKVIQRAADPRVHFVLNCGSAGCPAMRPELPTGERLEPFLQRAADDFLSDRRQVEVDHDRRQIVLSKIFDWYRADFVAHARRREANSDADLYAYLLLKAPSERRQELRLARDYSLRFRDHDWSINQSQSGSN